MSKVEIIDAADDVDDLTCKTFVINGEDHTIGNSLQFIISKYLDVNFCGYSIPHPLEDRIHFRIQSTGTPAIDILKRGLVELEELAAGVQAKFEEACQAAEVPLD